jgi:hypothetical protein
VFGYTFPIALSAISGGGLDRLQTRTSSPQSSSPAPVKVVSNCNNNYVFCSPHFHPGRSDFPSPVGDHSISFSSLPAEFIGLSACSHTPILHSVYCLLRFHLPEIVCSGSVSWRSVQQYPLCTESSFAFPRHYLFQE